MRGRQRERRNTGRASLWPLWIAVRGRRRRHRLSLAQNCPPRATQEGFHTSSHATDPTGDGEVACVVKG